MPLYFLVLIIIYLGATPAIFYAGYLEKKGLPAKAIATFSGPDGTKRQVQMDVSWSWTVFVFRGWALAFRGQFLPFLFVMIIGLFTFSMELDPTLTQGFGNRSTVSLGIFGIISQAMSPTGINPYVADWFANTDTGEIIMRIILLIIYLGVVNYYVAFANRERIKSYANRGFDFSQTPNVAALYKYIGHIPRTNPADLAPNVKPGQTHDYVVPDATVKKEAEDEIEDYSMLTVNDLKLLLKSEGIPFSTSNTKEELLKLVDKHIARKKNS